MTDSEIYVDGYDYAIDHPDAPGIPPAEIAMVRFRTKNLPGTATVWMNGWRAAKKKPNVTHWLEHWQEGDV